MLYKFTPAERSDLRAKVDAEQDRKYDGEHITIPGMKDATKENLEMLKGVTTNTFGTSNIDTGLPENTKASNDNTTALKELTAAMPSKDQSNKLGLYGVGKMIYNLGT